MRILVTGAAGFIGFHLCKKLIKENITIVALDNINDYYDQNLKFDRLAELGFDKNLSAVFSQVVKSEFYRNLEFIRLDLTDKAQIDSLYKKYSFDIVCNLAAQAGVRYSLENPQTYLDSNIIGFMNILEASKKYKVKHLIYASSSSVYGKNETMPFNTDVKTDCPLSLYAATKKTNEILAYTYSHLYNLPTTGLRFFTVYGPWGRPDMALFLFVDAIVNKKPIKVFNHGDMQRDFTYIDDIISGILAIIKNETGKRSLILNPYKIYNIGNNKSVSLMEFIDVIEKEIDLPVERKLLPLQPGDMAKTWADSTPLLEDYGYKPSIDIKIGIKQFINWYKNYYNIPNK